MFHSKVLAENVYMVEVSGHVDFIHSTAQQDGDLSCIFVNSVLIKRWVKHFEI